MTTNGCAASCDSSTEESERPLPSLNVTCITPHYSDSAHGTNCVSQKTTGDCLDESYHGLSSSNWDASNMTLSLSCRNRTVNQPDWATRSIDRMSERSTDQSITIFSYALRLTRQLANLFKQEGITKTERNGRKKWKLNTKADEQINPVNGLEP